MTERAKISSAVHGEITRVLAELGPCLQFWAQQIAQADGRDEVIDEDVLRVQRQWAAILGQNQPAEQ